MNVNEGLPEDILWRKSPARSLTDAWGNTGLINDCTITHTRQNHRIRLVCCIKTKNNLRSYNGVHEPPLCMKTRLLGCAGDVIEVGVWLWKILRYLAQSHDSPGHRTVHNVHKTSHSGGNVWSAQIAQAVKRTNYNTEKDLSGAAWGWCVSGWLWTRTGHLRWGRTARFLPNPFSGRQLWRHCECCNMKRTSLR